MHNHKKVKTTHLESLILSVVSQPFGYIYLMANIF
jgi:hypothetical protein